MASVAWSLSAILSTPQFYIFHTNYVTDTGPFQNMTVCESIWRQRPKIERKVFFIDDICQLFLSLTNKTRQWLGGSLCINTIVIANNMSQVE